MDALAARSSWKGLALVAHCWAVIALAMAVAILWPLTLPLAVMVIGARQLGLAILMHDAAHGALHPNRKVNDWVAEWLCGGAWPRYRAYHLQHHKYAQQAEDPDLVLSAPFPITRAIPAPQDRPRPHRPDLVQAALRAPDGAAEGAPERRGPGADPHRRNPSPAPLADLQRPGPGGIQPGRGCGGPGSPCGCCPGRPGSSWSRACATSPSTPWWPRTSPTPCATRAPPTPTRGARPDRPLFRQLPLRAPHVHACAVLEPAPRAAACWGARAFPRMERAAGYVAVLEAASAA